MVGATLTILVANTSTPAEVFRDAALSTPMTNPTSGADVSDAGGWFPQIFAAAGTLVDITLKDGDGVTVKSYVDVAFVGSDTGELSRTLADNTRFSVTGSGGRVLIQVGDPDPDDIGGKLTIEGWEGTQADEILLDAAAVKTTGTITENGKRLNAVVHTEATAFTAVSDIVIPLSNSPTGVRAWEVDVFDLIINTASGNAIVGQLSFDGGATYATDYVYIKTTLNGTGPVVVTNANAAGSSTMVLVTSGRTIATRPGWLRFTILTPDSGLDLTEVLMDALTTDNGATTILQHTTFRGYVTGSLGRATHLRLQQSGTTFDGKYRVAPLRGFNASEA